jgi:hypothetical protein
MMDASINISMEPSVPLWETIPKTANRFCHAKFFIGLGRVGSLLSVEYTYFCGAIELKELSLTLKHFSIGVVFLIVMWTVSNQKTYPVELEVLNRQTKILNVAPTETE